MTGMKFPQYTLRERVADGCIHVIGVAASLVALTALLIIGVQAQATLWIVSLSIYGLALVAMFTCSAGYNLIVRPKVKAVFRRLDHAAIFLMIAGTYTPFALMKMDAEWGLSLLAVVWTMAAIGIAIKLFAPRYLEGVTTALYLVQGWAVIVAWHPLVSAVPEQGCVPAHARRRALHRRRGVPSLGAAALPERHLARLRAGRRERSFRRRDRHRRLLSVGASPKALAFRELRWW